MSVDAADDKAFEVCQTDAGEYYVRSRATIKEIVGNVRQGHYCTILGSRYCQKSQLLRDVKERLEATDDEICVLLDLNPYADLADGDVLRGIAVEVDRLVREQGGGDSLPSPDEVVDEQSLKRFFTGYVHALKRDPVLLIDHLEDVRLGPLHSLLRALRAVYNERARDDDPCRLGVVVASSLIVRDLLLGKTSPFNIAQLTLVRDLSRDEGTQLVLSILAEGKAEITAEGTERLLSAAGGDRYLLQQLSTRCLRRVQKGGWRSVTEQDIVEAIDWIIREKAEHYRPLRETVYELEDKPMSLLNALKILKQGQVPRRELKLGLEMEWDDLQLTGAVSVETSGEEKIYRIRNEIYERYLKEHFTHERVAHVLSMAGQWDAAIDYLEQAVESEPSEPRLRSTLLGTILDSIYAARTSQEAYRNLASRLGRAFSFPRVRIYILNMERTWLKQVSQAGFDDETSEGFSLEETDRPEVSAYLNQHYGVPHDPGGEPVTLIPILRDQWQTLGVAAVYGLSAKPNMQEFQELLAFLKQVGRAVGSAIQWFALYETSKQVTDSLDLEQTMQTTVHQAIRAVPGAQRGALFLWDEAAQLLVIRTQSGYRETIADEVRMAKGVGYVGAVYETGRPIRMGNAMSDPLTFLKKDPDIRKAKSVICVPLQSWGRVTGVLCLDNVTAEDAFQESDLRLLSAFADQVAIAIQNAQLSAELDELGMSINREDFDLPQIFKQVVKSVTRVSGAKAATMILLSDEAGSWRDAVKKAPLSVSDGLDPDYDSKVVPRPEGLTFHVITERRPIPVNSEDDPIGINPLSWAEGVRAQIGLPMMIREDILGVLFVLHDKPRVFSEVEISMLSLFANQAAQAIKSKRQRDQIISRDTRLAQQEALRLTSRMVAHRLRNVLPFISDRIEKTLSLGMLDDKGAEYAGRALKETRRAQEIVSDFETFSRSELFARPDVLPGDEVVRRLGEVVKSNMFREDSQVAVCAEPGLPTVKFNFDKLGDDFVNFARDSERHKNTGLRVTISGEIYEEADAPLHDLRAGATYLRLIYTDNGPGVPAEIKERIFDPFHTTTDGSGLGLAIARHTAKVHEGTLIECGQAGGGVRFEVYLPAVSAAGESEATP
jgi:GAF domain-containing protein